MKQRLNFSPKPFRTREGMLLLFWASNLVLILALAGSVQYWLGLRERNSSAHREIDALKQARQSLVEDHRRLARELDGIDLKNYRKRTNQFYEIQTAYHTQWGRLLDDLSAILPDDVRIISLAPNASAGRNEDEGTIMKLSGEARTKSAQLKFIRTLQEQPAFGDVRFETEEYDRDGLAVSFELRFTHRPRGG